MKKQMKYIVLSLMFTIMIELAPINSVYAKIVKEGNISATVRWTLDDLGNLIVIGSGPIPEQSFKNNDDIYTVVVENGITEIGESSFARCSNLVSLTLSNTVTKIRNSAFYGCNKLENVSLSNHLQIIGASSFFACTNLRDIIIPNSVEELGKHCFFECVELKSVIMGNSINKIGDSAFRYCCSLPEINIPGTLKSISSFAFADCYRLTHIVIPSGTERIDESAFFNCNRLLDVVISQTVSEISPTAFCNCGSIRYFDVSENNNYYSDINGNLINKASNVLIKYAPNQALTEYAIPDGIVNVLENAFQDSNMIRKLTIPGSLINISTGTLIDCPELQEIQVSKNNTVFCSDGALYDKTKNLLVFYPPKREESSFSISLGTESVAINAFKNAKNLKYVYIPETVKLIETGAFEGCTSIVAFSVNENNQRFCSYEESLYSKTKDELIRFAIGKNEKCYVVPNGVTKIAPFAFADNKTLSCILLPDSLEKLGWNAFSNCDSLEDIYWGENLNSVGSETFWGCDNISHLFGVSEQKLKNIEIGSDCQTIDESKVATEVPILVISELKAEENISLDANTRGAFGDKDVIIASIYNKSGELLDAKIHSVDRTVTFNFANNNAKVIKLFWIKSIESLKPIVSPYEKIID